MKNKYGPGFTLVELVVVVLILGIMATISVPKMISVSTSAKDTAVLQSLTAVRDAIELYIAHNAGRYPGANGNESSFKGDLSKYLRKFPVSTVAPLNNSVAMDKNGPIMGDGNPTKGWKYFYTTGTFIINNRRPTETDPSKTYDEW